jgi:hypothetical protein
LGDLLETQILEFERPCIAKPVMLYTGKQVFTTIIKAIAKLKLDEN